MNLYPQQVLKDVENANFVSFLDMARWSAATIVFLGHLRDPLFLGYSDVIMSDRNIAIQIWYFLTGWLGEAVIIFFVLSGYLVGGLASARASKRLFSLTHYTIDRVSRLYVALIPALLLTALLDNLALHWLPDVGLYTQPMQPMIQQKNGAPFLINMTVSSFISNALMLQTIATPWFGSNGPLWTISLEFWFYAVFGIGLGSLLAERWARVAGFFTVVVLLLLLGAQFSVYMGLWICGVVAALIPWQRVERPLIAVFVFFSLLILMRAGHTYVHRTAVYTIRNYLVAMSFSWVLVSMRSIRSSIFERMMNFNRFMADFSYSLYLIHFPLMLFSLDALYATGHFDVIARGYSPASGKGLLVYGIVIALVYPSAWLFSQATERQTWKVRRYLKRALTKISPTVNQTLPG